MCIHSIPKLGVDKTMFWRLEGWNPIYSGNGKLSPERIFQFPTQSLVSDHFWKSGEVGSRYLVYVSKGKKNHCVCEKKICNMTKPKLFPNFQIHTTKFWMQKDAAIWYTNWWRDSTIHDTFLRSQKHPF